VTVRNRDTLEQERIAVDSVVDYVRQRVQDSRRTHRLTARRQRAGARPAFHDTVGNDVAMLGMAVGTGNIWRFPRVAATNGGGSFLVAWVVFLLLWSIPLILVEFWMGKATRSGNVGAFSRIMGKRYAWMGAWVAWTATAIMFYYAVVAGWTIRYSSPPHGRIAVR
jgi:SNF family Na+-dependent transporter